MWIKLDDGFATHPKVLAAGPIPALIQVRAICYASQHKTDGFIPEQAVMLLLSGFDQLGIDLGKVGNMASFGCQANDIEWAPKMVEYGLWEERPGGYYIHDYLDWNMSKDAYLEMKDKLSKAGRKGMKSRWKGTKVGYNPPNNPPYNKPITQQSTSISTLNPLNSLNSPNPEFEQFWKLYPRKTGKKDALKAFEKAKDKPPLPELIAALQRASRSEQWTKDNGQYIPNPATWLNQGRWEDQPIEQKPSTMMQFLSRAKEGV